MHSSRAARRSMPEASAWATTQSSVMGTPLTSATTWRSPRSAAMSGRSLGGVAEPVALSSPPQGDDRLGDQKRAGAHESLCPHCPLSPFE